MIGPFFRVYFSARTFKISPDTSKTNETKKYQNSASFVIDKELKVKSTIDQKYFVFSQGYGAFFITLTHIKIEQNFYSVDIHAFFQFYAIDSKQISIYIYFI